MVKEYYGQEPLIPEKNKEKVAIVFFISVLIIICFSGFKILIQGSSPWSENIGIEYFINKHGRLISLLGWCICLAGLVLNYLLMENIKLKRRVKLLEEQITVIKEKL